MSKIAFIYIAPILRVAPYYEQYTEALKARHTILHIHLFSGEIPKNTSEKIINFDPDLIITFNHVSNDYIYKNTNCPVLIVNADSFQSMYHKDLMKKYQDRIYIDAGHSNRIKLYYDWIPFVKKDRIISFPAATSLKNEKIKQDINLSIISTIVGLSLNNKLVSLIKENRFNQDKLSEIHATIEECRKNLNTFSGQFSLKYEHMFHYLSYQTRVYILDQIADLGLKVFGKYYDEDCIFSSLPNLSFCLSDREIISAKENQEIYNRSKLSINLHFAQNPDNKNISSYSWRVPDVMATNSCLVSTHCDALRQDFGKWVDIPMFSNRYEARELCKKLLDEDGWRNDIIAASNLAIKEGGFTFENRVKVLEDIFNLKISENNQCNEFYTLIKPTKEKHKGRKLSHLKIIEKYVTRPLFGILIPYKPYRITVRNTLTKTGNLLLKKVIKNFSNHLRKFFT